MASILKRSVIDLNISVVVVVYLFIIVPGGMYDVLPIKYVCVCENNKYIERIM